MELWRSFLWLTHCNSYIELGEWMVVEQTVVKGLIVEGMLKIHK